MSSGRIQEVSLKTCPFENKTVEKNTMKEILRNNQCKEQLLHKAINKNKKAKKSKYTRQ
jgi:hypothetical protein